MTDEEARQDDVRRQPEADLGPERGQDPPVELRVTAERDRLRHHRRDDEGGTGMPQARGIAGQPTQPGQQAEDARGQNHEQHPVQDPAHRRAPPASRRRRCPASMRLRRSIHALASRHTKPPVPATEPVSR